MVLPGSHTHLNAKPVVPSPDLSVELGDGNEGLEALASADQPTLVHIEYSCSEGFLVLQIHEREHMSTEATGHRMQCMRHLHTL